MNKTFQKRGAIYHSDKWKSYGTNIRIAEVLKPGFMLG
jgi:hypothetical protein